MPRKDIEAELRRALRELRTAIDKFKDAADQGQVGSLDNELGNEGYPPDLETLVEGVTVAGDASGGAVLPCRRGDDRAERRRAARADLSARLSWRARHLETARRIFR